MKIDHSYSRRSEKRGHFIRRFYLPALLCIAAALLFQTFLRYFYAFPVTLTMNNMAPQFQQNERLFFQYPYLTKLKSEMVVLINLPHSSDAQVCRAAAMEGQTIEILNGEVKVSGKTIRHNKKEKYFSAELSNRDNIPATIIRPGHFFCLNDNLDDWNDSRMWGALPLSAIHGIQFDAFYLW
ncbi:MAG: signal peptidase I [Leptospiraceae bacterium]|nr:signal peptidase I [Leptospiraceae bacterium]